VTLNNALVAAVNPDGVAAAQSPATFGAWVENACLAYAWNAGQSLHYWREEPLEVDGVIEGTWGAWAIEVKTGRFQARDLDGLLEFARRFPRFKPLVVCDAGTRPQVERLGVAAITWQEYLLDGLGPSR
jgi:predicted AAA+ superfamily ATPase